MVKLGHRDAHEPAICAILKKHGVRPYRITGEDGVPDLLCRLGSVYFCIEIKAAIPIPRRRDFGKRVTPSWICWYVYRLATLTNWAFDQILWKIPLAAGLQIIDCDLFKNNIPRVYVSEGSQIDALAIIDKALNEISIRQDAV